MGFVLVTLVALTAVGLWWVLCYWIFAIIKPRLNRWLWHRLGGHGDPPE